MILPDGANGQHFLVNGANEQIRRALDPLSKMFKVRFGSAAHRVSRKTEFGERETNEIMKYHAHVHVLSSQ